MVLDLTRVPLQICKNYALIVFVIVSSLVTVSSLKCAQCMSLHNHNCETGHVNAILCQGEYADSKYCYKSKGQIQFGQFVMRGCTSHEWQTPCHKQMIEDQLTDVCTATCSTDGCNSAPSMPAKSALMFLSCFLTIYFIYLS